MKKILLVEDEAVITLDIRRRLEGLGYTVMATLSTGEEALESIEKEMPNLVMMDINLAGKIDGTETVKRLNKLYDIPVLYLTASTDEDTLNKTLQTAPYGYIHKPVDTATLRYSIESALEQHRLNQKFKEKEEALASANQRLERLNEELDATNEELSSTNEEFEATNEELEQSNAELTKTRDDLAEREARYRAIFENTNNGVVIYRAIDKGEDFIIEDFNRAAEKFEKVKSEKVIGKPVTAVFPGVSEFGLLAVLRKVYRSGNSEKHDVSLYKDERISGWRENYVYKLPTGELVVVYSDRTKEKQDEEKIIESELFLSSTFNAITDGISVLTPDLTIMRVNSMMNEWYKENLPLEGKKCYEAYHNQNIPCDPCPSIRAIQSGTHERNIVPGLPGSPAEWIELTSFPIKDPDTGTVTAIIEYVRDITTRVRAEEVIQANLREKEMLLREIHHRVKNNMQVISSLLNLQLNTVENEHDRELFIESQNRIRSMAMVHENLYQSDNLADVDFHSYIIDLIDYLKTIYSTDGIEINVSVEDVRLGIDRAVPAALIINELITNSIKHAFSEHNTGVVDIRFAREKGGAYILSISDNGAGFPDGIDFRSTESLGLQLINVLTDQLHGKVELTHDNGTIITQI